MSKITLSGNASGTGTLTIASPNTNSDRTLTLPDSAGTLATAESTLTQFNASGSAPVFAARAWVNFNGTGTVAIRASGNVSSITDVGTGWYTVNFTTAMPDDGYAALPSYGFDGSGPGPVYGYQTHSTTQFSFRTANSSVVLTDYPRVSVAFFR